MRVPRIQKRSRTIASAWILLFAGNFCFHKGLQGGEAFGGRTVTSIGGGSSTRSDFLLETAARRTATRRKRAWALQSNADEKDGPSSNANAPSYWHLPNDFSMFLTQRSIQSFMFLTSQLRDPETCYWVEDFTQPNLVQKHKATDDFSLSEAIPNLGNIATAGTRDWSVQNSGGSKDADKDSDKDKDAEASSEADQRTCHLLRYHGLAAMDTTLFPTWEAYFENLLEEPTDTWVIASDQPHIPDYTWEIDPNSLCSRILSVREQLSKEFVKDLQAVSDMGGQTFDWYWDKLKQSRATGGDTENDSADHPNDANHLIDSSSLRGSRENLLFLEINVDDPTLDHKPSPLRRGNFDLLVLLATEEAIHRVLNQWESKRSEGELVGAEQASHAFLEEFYQDRQHFFHGPLPNYGKADDVLEELLDSALLFKAVDGGDDASVVHPTKIAELVLKEREKVALDWMEIARQAPMHHMRIQKLRLDKMMMKNSSGNSNGGGDGALETNGGGFAESTRNGGFDPGPGAFE